MEILHNPEARHRRLNEHTAHIFSPKAFATALREEPEYHKNHHTGLTLMKTPELRMILEAVEAGVTLVSHVVHGPATLYLVEGRLEIQTPDGSFPVNAGDIVVLPRGSKREIRCHDASVFLLALSPEA